MSFTPTALITGASAGIGRDYARLLAGRGYNLILTARRTQLLNTLKAELETAFNIRVDCFPADLAKPQAPAQLKAKIDAAGLEVDYLVNNAGYSVPGFFRDVRWEVERDMIQVMATAVAELCHLFGPAMATRGMGRIVNVSSAAAFLNGSAGGTLYPAIKSFVLRLSQSLAIEYRGTGVHVVALCPGFTYSDFHDVAGNRDEMNKLPSFLWLTGPRVVREAHEAVEADTGPVIINGWSYKLTALLMRWLPQNLLTKRASLTSRNAIAREEDKIAVASKSSRAAPKRKTAAVAKKPSATKKTTASRPKTSSKGRKTS
jgi:short-subunit dehydrogenase